MADDDSVLLVAEGEAGLVGYGMIDDVFVTKPHRRRGVGERLYRAARAHIEGRGARRIEVRVVATNEASSAFWGKMGFRAYLATMYAASVSR